MVQEEEIDERFKQVLTDPRFRQLRRKDRKIKVDSRFKGMFGKKFNGQCLVDKRGRRIDHATEKTLKKFYEVSDNEEQEDTDDEEEEKDVEDETQDKLADESDSESDDGDKVLKKHSVNKIEEKKVNFNLDEPIASTSGIKNEFKKITDLRGENNDLLSSSSDEESSEDEDDEEIDHEWGELDKEVTRGEEVTNRLAICNVDWDRIKAQDLFVLLNSFKPATGEIKSVQIYPSQFGKERMREEELRGPKELTEVTLDEQDEDPFLASRKLNDDDDVINTDSPFVSEKLRKYQINRLKYYYAVVECDTRETAQNLYDQLDGMEYESSASTLDLRFIPDGMTFDDDEPSSECFEMPSLLDYKPPLFITTALQQSKVKLTWDETDPDRCKTLQRAFSERDKIADDLSCYLASSSSEEEEEELKEENISMDGVKSVKDRISKYKDLLKSVEEEKEEDKDIDMEVTWEPDLEKLGNDLVEKKKMEGLSVFERERLEKKSTKNGKTSISSKKNVNKSENDEDCAENYSEDSEKEENGSDTSSGEDKEDDDKEALSLLVMDDNDDKKKHFDYDDYIENKKSKRKKKKKDINTKEQEDNFEFNAEDPRFTAIYNSHLYNVDQSSSQFKKTKAYEEILKRKASKDPDEGRKRKKNEDNSSLKSLIERAKLKTSKVSKWKKVKE